MKLNEFISGNVPHSFFCSSGNEESSYKDADELFEKLLIDLRNLRNIYSEIDNNKLKLINGVIAYLILNI